MKHHTKEITTEFGKLTKHPEGSVRELFTISFPLMLSILSGNLMLFLDRLILANFSLEAMNAAATSGIICMVLIYGAIGIASIAEVFVGQFNGAKQYLKVAGPVWQMVWFSLATIFVFTPIAMYGGKFLLSDYYYQEYSLPYFQWILYFGPLFPLQAALSSFFIGLGHVKLVTLTTILSNIVNVVLDIILVFGVSNLIPPLLTKGAAIATGLAQSIQVLLLLIVFLKRSNRQTYQTHHFKLNAKLLLKCLRVGFPSAVGHMIEISAWAVIVQMMVGVSAMHLTAVTVGQSFYSIIAFGMEGLQKGVMAITANFIGAKKWDKVSHTWRSAVKLLFVFAGLFSIIMIIYPDPLILEFLSVEVNTKEFDELYSLLRIVCAFVWLYFIFDGLTWISAGVLTAAGDTVFVMLMNAVSAWVFAFLPVYVLIVVFKASPGINWIIVNFYGAMNALCFYLRYRQGKWRNNKSNPIA